MDVSYTVDNQSPQQKPSMINTSRLKPIRQITRGAIINILETGHVSIEFFKRRGDLERVAEILVVSGDGTEICLQQIRPETAAVDQGINFFTYENLPEKLWRKYQLARRVVDLAKSKTPKVTIFSETAKGVLMENMPPAFEASFYNAGPRVSISGKEVQIKESENGTSHTLQLDRLSDFVSHFTLDLVQHAKQLREQCLRLEASISRLQDTSCDVEHLFPVTVGTRPSSFCSSTSSVSDRSFGAFHPSSGSFHLSPSESSPISPEPQPTDFSLIGTPRKSPPAPYPSPCHPPSLDSPVRHLSTLESRHVRRQISFSPDSSFFNNHNSASSAPRQEAGNIDGTFGNIDGTFGNIDGTFGNIDGTFSHGQVEDSFFNPESVESGHGLASSMVFTNDLDWSQHLMTSTPCVARNAAAHFEWNRLGQRVPDGRRLQNGLASHTMQKLGESTLCGNYETAWSDPGPHLPQATGIADVVHQISNSFEALNMKRTVEPSQFEAEMQGIIEAQHKQNLRNFADNSLPPSCDANNLALIPSPADLTLPQSTPVRCRPSALGTPNSPTKYATTTPTANSSQPTSVVNWSSDCAQAGIFSSFGAAQNGPTVNSTKRTDCDFVRPENLPSTPNSRTSTAATPCLDTLNGQMIPNCRTVTNDQANGPMTDSPNSQKPDSSLVLKQAFIMYTGWATQLANGSIWIRYNEGTQLAINPKAQGPMELVYVDQSGHKFVYQQGDSSIPVYVRQKLERLPSILESLQNSSSASACDLPSA